MSTESDVYLTDRSSTSISKIMAENLVKKLRMERGSRKAAITRIEKYFQAHTIVELDYEDVAFRQEQLRKSYEQYQAIEIELLLQDDEPDSDDIEDRFTQLSVQIERLKKQLLIRTQEFHSQGSSDNYRTTHIPSIDIQIFDGKDITCYKPFMHLFTAIIHKDTRLSDVQKLVYLKKYIKGEPLTLIDNLPLINASYESALKILETRYNNPMPLANNHITSILDLPGIHQGTAQQLRDLVAQVRQQISALKNMKEPVDYWDSILVCIISRKLDPLTVRLLHEDRDIGSMPTINELLIFLDKRAMSLEKQDSPSSGNEIKVFCPNCNTEVPHTAEGIQEDQTKILVAKVYHYFEHEYEELKKMYGDLDPTPLSKFRQQTALATGVSETMVLQILKEEERRNADKRQVPTEKRCRARKRATQTDSSSEEYSSDDNVDDGGPSSFVQVAQHESEIETVAVKIEPPEYYNAQHESEIETVAVKIEPPEYYIEQAQTIPISAEVKAEPPDDDVNNTQESSQWSHNIIIETGHHQDQFSTRPTINDKVNNNKKENQKENQKRYRERNRELLKRREAERRKRIQYSQSIAGPTTSSNTNIIELNNDEMLTSISQSSSDLEKTQPSPIQRNERDKEKEMNALQKKRERQQRYREQHRDKLNQRKAERRRRLQNADMITELPNIEFIEIINEPIIDETSTNSRSVAGLGEMQHLVVEVSQQNGRHQAQITNETLALNEPAGTKRKARKKPRRSDVTSTRQHTQGESSITGAASSVRLTEELDESGLLGEAEVKVEEIEIGEEGFS